MEVSAQADLYAQKNEDDNYERNVAKETANKILVKGLPSNFILKLSKPIMAMSTKLEARPSRPSIILIALVNPTTAIIVIGMDNIPSSMLYDIPKR